MTRRTWLFIAAALMLVTALGGLGSVASASFPNSPAASVAQSVSEQTKGEQPFDCSQISALGVEKQTNLRAYEILKQCGKLEASKETNAGENVIATVSKILSPLAYGGPDVNIAFETTAYPKVTQSESFVWGNGNTVVATINDSRNSPGCYGGGSYSLDGGVTWSRIGGTGPSPFCSGRGTNYGDPTIVYSTLHSKWFASFLATGCQGQGIGVWESPDGVTWTVSPTCAHNGSADDRQSHWIDNNPASPYYGRQYISWNDFGAGQVIRVVWSDNGGVSWSAPVNLTTSFIRNVQITGDLQGSGTVYLAGMNEGGGGLNPRQNIIYKSTNGGTTWTSTVTGPTFYPPGRAVSGYFAGMYPGAYFRHMGWGQPAASGPNVHYVYAMGIQGTDAGNMMYVRSTDSGQTWSTPMQLNTDTTTRAQFMGNLAANAQGSLFTGWYDERETTTCPQQGQTAPCYRRWGRASTDNGATWMADDMVGDVISPLPAQPDPNVQPLYAGDYDYASANGNMFYQTWTDGRVIINNNSQQDVFFDRIPLVQGTPTPTVTGTPPTATRTNTRTNTPTATATVCGGTANYSYTATTGATVVAGTTNIGSACDDCVTDIALPFPFRLYDQTFNAVGLDSNGKAHFPTGATVFTNTCLPQASATHTIYPYWEDLRTDTGANCPTGGCGIFTSISGTAPNRIFNIEWRTVLFTGGAYANFVLRLYEGTTDSRFDVIYGVNPGNTSATGGVQRDQTVFTQAFCNGAGQATTAGTMLAYRQPACITSTPGSPVTNTATRTGTAGVTGTVAVSPTVCPPGGGAWTAGPAFPVSPGVVRSVGVYFPPNGRFYSMGGRSADTAGNDIRNPYEFNPTNSTWTMKAAQFSDANVNNMACGVITLGGTTGILCAGGSAGGGTTATAETRFYNPVADTMTILTSDPYTPGNSARLPGGFAVHNNKLYTIGGFEINVAMTNEVWEFDPARAAGSRWLQRANMPVARGYVPATTIGNFIYTAGGSDYQAGALVDTMDSFRYDPVANTWTTITNIPRAVAETRAVTLAGEMYVLGGGRTSPNPSNQVDVYNPGTNSWRVAAPFPAGGRRNFAADSNGTDRIWRVGGYNSGNAVNPETEIYMASGGQCPTPGTSTVVPTTAVATNTATRTNTATIPVPPTTAVPPPTTAVATATRTNTVAPTNTVAATSTTMATATTCAMNFVDVDQYNPFRIYIKCLYCAGVLGGYSTNPPCTSGTPCFRPYDNMTRGQVAKVVSNASGNNMPPGAQIFSDVPPTHPFFVWINRLARAGVLGGYDDPVNCPGIARPCYRPERPVTRGQLAKIASNAAGYSDVPPAGTISFTDVPTNHPFYIWVERLARRGIINGYDCGGPSEPCDAQRRPYYRPMNLITRGQASKIVSNTFFPSCQPPIPPSTPPARPQTEGPADH